MSTYSRPHSALALLLVAAGSCAPNAQVPVPPLSETNQYARLAVADPTDLDASLMAAVGCWNAGCLETARAVVASTYEALGDPWSTIMLGVIEEELGDPERALGLYEEYLALPTAAFSDAVTARRDVVQGEGTRRAVERQFAAADLSSLPELDTTSVAVLPFGVEGGSQRGEAVAAAITDLLARDLAKLPRITVVNRTRSAAVLAQVAATDDPGDDLLARAAVTLGAGRLILGRYVPSSDGTAVVSTSLATVRDGVLETSDPFDVQDNVDLVAGLEKRAALLLVSAMTGRLTDPQREAISERFTDDPGAFEAYGQGLVAADNGDFDSAAESFRRAANLDPSFLLVRAHTEQAVRAGRSAISRESFSREVATLSVQERSAIRVRRAAGVDVSGFVRGRTVNDRQTFSEVLGQDRLGGSVVLDLFLRIGGLQ